MKPTEVNYWSLVRGMQGLFLLGRTISIPRAPREGNRSKALRYDTIHLWACGGSYEKNEIQGEKKITKYVYVDNLYDKRRGRVSQPATPQGTFIEIQL